VPDLSVCIVNWNTREQLRRCLRSLRDHAEGLELQVIVVDNASADGSAEMVRAEFAAREGEGETVGWKVELIANADNRGYAAGNNQALARAEALQVLLLNPDIVVKPGALRALAACAERHPKAGAVAPRLVYPDGRLQASCRSFPTPDIVLYEALGLSRLFSRSRRFGKYRMTWWDYDDERPVDQPMASALMLRREALEAMGDAAVGAAGRGPIAGAFDEDFPIFFNDVDLCKRLWDAGWEIWFTPKAEMVHEHGASTSQVPVRMAVESYRGLVRFYAKHYRGKIGAVGYWGALGLLTLSLPVRMAKAWMRRR